MPHYLRAGRSAGCLVVLRVGDAGGVDEGDPAWIDRLQAKAQRAVHDVIDAVNTLADEHAGFRTG